ncbi:myosin regulatory light chain 2-like [Homarus americanus]|uniref:Myosin regulatory light chain 2-like 1 n=1 Tax=Homarus americanus TaxID=6706 RepID=A0A8J5K0B9_HOMAM|nr:myosin regulatory light chain 2-like [Homarus americanus]KAG7167762.1 Myosin regulatory light chain 2-like 1 [Homarus americanus]
MSRKSGSRSSSKRGSKKSGGGSNVFDMFTQRQVAEFKEGFQLMDRDKDGVIGKNDLRGTFDEIGRIATDQELDEMLADAPAPINFTMLLNMFAERQTGESDDDDVVAKAFIAFSDEEGLIDCDTFRHALMTWGDKFSAQEADDAIDQMDVGDDGKIDVQTIIQMLTAGAGDDAAAGEGEEA